MMMMTIMSTILSLSFSMPLMTQPISLGLALLALSLMTSLAVFFSSSTWFSFILFLIYIGGLLVMFAYVTALIPNLMFKKSFMWYFFMLSVPFWLLLLMNSNLLGIMMEEQPKMILSFFLNHNHLGATLYSPFNLMTIVGLALILFFALICVVKICYFSNAPLRPYNS